MPFGKQITDPEEIIKQAFGMGSEDIKAKFAKIDALETAIGDVKNLSTSQSTALGDIKETLGKMSTPYSRPAAETTTTTTTEEKPNWGEDADGAFIDRSKPIMAAILDTRAMVAKREAMEDINANNPDLPFQKFAAEIEELTKNESLQSKANPLFWKNVYYVAVGQKRQDIEKDRASKSGRFYSEPASSSIVVNADDNAKPEDKLTAGQIDAARKSGLTPAQYAEQLKSIQVWS